MRRCIAASFLALTAASAQAGGISDFFGSVVGRFNFFGAGPEGQAKQLDDTLRKVSEYMNKRMPEAVDAYTRLDRVSAEPGPHFSYHYTLLDRSGAEVDKAAFMAAIRPELKNRVCANTQVRSFFHHGVTVAYMYMGNDGQAIGGAEFAPNSCDDLKETASRL